MIGNKFRAWDKERKEMSFFDLKTITSFGFGVRFGSGMLCDIEGTPCDPTYKIFMLFTGLKDKNGKEIYDRDVVSHPAIVYPSKGVVAWGEEYPQFYIRLDDGRGLNWGIIVNKQADVEVIGNVFKNPELLKEPNHAE